jgi:uncharacterized protein YlzI (FlbEa/FlbD family)
MIKVILENNETIVLNERLVCSIYRGLRITERNDYLAIVTMVNGKEYIVKNPPYSEWENDCHLS